MARAKAYDQYEDPGMAVAEDTAADFTLDGFVAHRVDTLVARGVWATKMADMNLPKPELTQRAIKLIRDRAAWYCRVGQLEGLDFSVAFAPPSPQSKDGKNLAGQILRVELRDWLYGWLEDASAAMRWYVTVARRAGVAQEWGRPDWSQANKVANAVSQEVNAAQKLITELESLPKG